MNKKYKTFLIACLSVFAFCMPSPEAQAYETGIHFYLTYILAHVCGLGTAGETAALATYSVDMFADTDAGSHFDEWLDPTKETTRRIFHFAVDKGEGLRVVRDSSWAWQTITIATEEASPQNINPISLGIGIHTLQDSFAHEGYTATLGHWTQAPDLPKNDVDKLVEAAQSTWNAMDGWSKKVYGHGCVTQFSSLTDRIQAWGALDLDSDTDIHSTWNGIAEKIIGKKIVIGDSYQTPEFSAEFEKSAAHIYDLKL